MNTAPELTPAIALALIAKYSTATPAGLRSMWVSSQCWLEEALLPGADLTPAAAEAAAALYTCSILERDAAKRQALRLSAYELVMLFRT